MGSGDNRLSPKMRRKKAQKKKNDKLKELKKTWEQTKSKKTS